MSEMVRTQNGALRKGGEILSLATKLQDSIKQRWNDDALDKITDQGKEIIALAEGMEIKTHDDYQKANELLLRIKQYSKTGDSYCDPFKKAAYSPYSMVLDIRKQIVEPGDRAARTVSNKLIKYRREQERIREEQQRKEDEARRKREAAERAKLERKAEKELEKGNEEKAEDLLDAAESTYVPPTVIEPTTAKTEAAESGRVTFPKAWEVNVKNLKDVAKAVVSGELPETFLKIDIAAIKKYAQATQIKRYDKNGLEIFQTETTSGRWNKG